MNLRIHLLRTVVAGLLAGQPATAAEFYVHPDGNDSHPGELEQPFATVTRAQEAVSPVDTVWAAQTGSGSPNGVRQPKRGQVLSLSISTGCVQREPRGPQDLRVSRSWIERLKA